MSVMIKTDELAPFIGTCVGYIRINKTWTYRNNNYECAAWYEDYEAVPGVYELTLKINDRAPHDLYFMAKVDALVTDDYFPALWGGVSISKKPYVPSRLGQSRIIYHKVDIVEGVIQTGNTPGNDIDVCINPFLIDGLVNSAKKSMVWYKELMDNYWAKYSIGIDDNYNTNLGMVAHCTENIADCARDIDKLIRQQRNFNEATEYMSSNYARNIAWVSNSKSK